MNRLCLGLSLALEHIADNGCLDVIVLTILNNDWTLVRTLLILTPPGTQLESPYKCRYEGPVVCAHPLFGGTSVWGYWGRPTGLVLEVGHEQVVDSSESLRLVKQIPVTFC